MHEYYRKNEEKFRKALVGYISPIAEELEKDLGLPFDELIGEVWTCYRDDMLENFPYIGGDRASGTRNLTGAYCFVALGVVTGKHGMSLERWGYLTTLAYERYFERMPKIMSKACSVLLKHPNLVTKMLRKKEGKNRKNAAENPGSFETETSAPTEDYPIIYTTKVCPLSDFAEKYGYREYMPYICNLDYVMFGALGVPFYREKTVSSGDDCCDFKMAPGKPVVPAWPCHSADPSDPLK